MSRELGLKKGEKIACWNWNLVSGTWCSTADTASKGSFVSFNPKGLLQAIFPPLKHFATPLTPDHDSPCVWVLRLGKGNLGETTGKGAKNELSDHQLSFTQVASHLYTPKTSMFSILTSKFFPSSNITLRQKQICQICFLPVFTSKHL